MKIWFPFFISILEREETPVCEKEKAFDALLDVLDDTDEFDQEYMTGEFIPSSQLCIRILSLCFKWLTSNEKSTIVNMGIGRLLWYSIYHESDSGVEPTSRVIDNELTIPWILERICSEEDKEHKMFFDVLATFAQFSEKEDRDTIVIRYYNGLTNAISSIFTRDIIHIDKIDSFCRNFEIVVPMMALMPSVLWRWAMTTKLAGERDKIGVCRVLLHALKTSLESTSTLQRLLGTGILAISSDFSCFPGPHDYREVADVFRSILEKYPGFNQQFREWTAKGAEGNMVAELGRSIPSKDVKRGTDYVFYEEDKAI